MRGITGIDLSLTSTGVVTIRDGVITIDRVRSKGAAGASLQERASRLFKLATDITRYAERGDLVVIEAPAFSRSNPGMHDRSGLWWLVVDNLSDVCDVVEVAPSARAKYATGKGNAGKDEVLAAVVRRYPDAPVGNNDEADALVLAAMGARHLGEPIDDLPLIHLTGMSKVRWPLPQEATF
jgi:Holliday junction resolvasome RuvABC endonuclease subunit